MEVSMGTGDIVTSQSLNSSNNKLDHHWHFYMNLDLIGKQGSLESAELEVK